MEQVRVSVHDDIRVSVGIEHEVLLVVRLQRTRPPLRRRRDRHRRHRRCHHETLRLPLRLLALLLAAESEGADSDSSL